MKSTKVVEPMSEESGSAVVEFVVVALPLFIPALIFFMGMTNAAKDQMESTLIARQALHAFLSSKNDLQANLRVSTLIQEYKKVGGEKYAELSYRVECSTLPCLTPNGVVEISIRNSSTRDSVARGYVDKWL